MAVLQERNTTDGLGVGVLGLMCLVDPERGRYSRALIRIGSRGLSSQTMMRRVGWQLQLQCRPPSRDDSSGHTWV
jgi:hypothetical protein